MRNFLESLRQRFHTGSTEIPPVRYPESRITQEMIDAGVFAFTEPKQPVVSELPFYNSNTTSNLEFWFTFLTEQRRRNPGTSLELIKMKRTKSVQLAVIIPGIKDGSKAGFSIDTIPLLNMTVGKEQTRALCSAINALHTIGLLTDEEWASQDLDGYIGAAPLDPEVQNLVSQVRIPTITVQA